MNQHRIQVVNRKNRPADFMSSGEIYDYVGRPSPLGNPFTHDPKVVAAWNGSVVLVPTREESIAAYRRWLTDQFQLRNPAILQEIERLYQLSLKAPLNLECWCFPDSCHADFLVDVLRFKHMLAGAR